MKKSHVDRFFNRKVVKHVLSDYRPTLDQREGLAAFFEIHGYRDSEDIFSRLANFVKNGVIDFISENKRIISLNRMSVEYFTVLYGPIEGPIKWERVRQTLSDTLPTSMNRWIAQGLSEDEASAKVREHQISASRASQRRDHRLYSPRCIEYWIARGYSHCDATAKVSDSQRRDVSFFVSTYGEDGKKRFSDSASRRSETWAAKSNEELLAHAIKTTPKSYNESGQEMQAVRLFLSQNQIEESRCKFGPPGNQFYQWIPGVGFRRYDLAVFKDASHTDLTDIMEFHGPGHINFSDYREDLRDQIITINGRRLSHLGTYGESYYNDISKRKHILDNFPSCNYHVFWVDDLKNKNMRIKCSN